MLSRSNVWRSGQMPAKRFVRTALCQGAAQETTTLNKSASTFPLLPLNPRIPPPPLPPLHLHPLSPHSAPSDDLVDPPVDPANDDPPYTKSLPPHATMPTPERAHGGVPVISVDWNARSFAAKIV
eukprot:3872435-Rhodomonas_salina.1